jgi:Zn-dependent protease with chaperone function
VTNRIDPIVLHVAIILGCVLTLLYYLRKNANKWLFGVLSTTFAILILGTYSLPYQNYYFQPSTSIHIYDQYKEIKKNLSEIDNYIKQQNLSGGALKASMLNKLYEIKVQFIFVASSDLFVILLMCFLLFFVLLKSRDHRSVRMEMLSAQGPALMKRFEGPIDKGYFVHVFVFWVIVSCYLYALVYTTLSVFELSIFGKNRLLFSTIAESFVKDVKFIVSFLLPANQTKSDSLALTLIVAYCLPLFYVIYRVMKKRMLNYIKVRVERKRYLLTESDRFLKIHGLFKQAAAYSGVTTPDMVVVPSKLPRVSTVYAGFPIFRPYIRLTDGVFKLKSLELMCLIVHEMYHIKRHSFKWYLLNLFSDITFFGTGFLSIATDSYQFELDADSHAACWAKENGAVLDFINALQIVSMSYSTEIGLELDIGGGDFIISKEEKMEESLIDKSIGKIDAFFELYFGDEILSYIHPPLEKRIERIKEIGGEKISE